jgi:PAS domain S-box-containing protein
VDEASKGEAARSAVLDAESIVARYSGPACFLDSQCAALLANPAWERLGIVDSEGRGDMPAELAAAVLAASATATPQRVGAHLPKRPDAPTRAFEFTLIPVVLDGSHAVLVLADDRALHEALSEALVDSRAFHRDLAQCANDAIWQIDAGGRFVYIGKGGILGHLDQDLHGTRFSDLVTPRSEGLGALVFSSREPIYDAEVWLLDRAGEERCFLISAVPIFADDGDWAGMRGVGRDVTEQRIREAELAQMRRSQRLVNSVLHAMRSEARPEAMLQAAVTVVIDTVGLAGCIVLMTPDSSFSTAEITANSFEGERLAECFRTHIATLTELCRRVAGDQEPVTVKARIEDWHVMLALTRYGSRLNGAVVFIRTDDAVDEATGEVWTADDGILLRAMSEQVGVTTEQLQMYRDRRRRVS